MPKNSSLRLFKPLNKIITNELLNLFCWSGICTAVKQPNDHMGKLLWLDTVFQDMDNVISYNIYGLDNNTTNWNKRNTRNIKRLILYIHLRVYSKTIDILRIVWHRTSGHECRVNLVWNNQLKHEIGKKVDKSV